MSSSREKLLYPLKVAFLLLSTSILVYILFTAFPIAYSIYIAFTDASAKNIASGPQLHELENMRNNITVYLESRRNIITQDAAKIRNLLTESIEMVDKLINIINSSTPETISLVSINKIRVYIDSNLNTITSSRDIMLDPRIRDPLEIAMRIFSYKVWQPIDNILLLKIEVTENDLNKLKNDVIPALAEAKQYMIAALKAIEFVEKDYEDFIRSVTRELDVKIEELKLHFIGLDNFKRLFGNVRFPYSIIKTLLFVTTSVPLKVVAGSALAFIYTSPMVYARRFMRGLLLLPWALPVLLSVTTWRILFTPERGQLSMVLEEYFGGSLDIYTNEWHAFLVYNIVEMWLAYPFVMTVTMAAIASIPREYLEAALIDGAGSLQIVRSVILPLILRPVAFAAILTTGASLQAFMVPLLINNGGPAKSISLPGFIPATGFSNEMIVLYGYNRAWLDQDYGLSAAAFIIMVLILLFYAIAWYYLLYRRGWSSV